LWEIYATILDDPTSLLGELHDSAFRLEEEEVLGVGNGDRCVSFFRAGSNLVADGANKELVTKLATLNV